MYKRLVLVLALFFLLGFLWIREENSYAFEDCENKDIEAYEVTTLNLEDYLKQYNYSELISFCSYNRCYEVKEGDIKTSIKNFDILYHKYLDSDEELEVIVKGYPITSIKVNAC